MAPKNRIIIDTDPGVDDVLALLLALSADPEVLEVALLSVTFGNVPRVSTAKNALSMFHVLYHEMKWREENGKDNKNTFGALRTYKPLIALGAQHALEEKLHAKDGFHGEDGLHGVHAEYPDLTIKDTWEEAFKNATLGEKQTEVEPYTEFFKTTAEPSHKEILRLLRESPPDTISIVALGPLTTIAMAAAEDPEAFLRVKELVVMGGAVNVPGNITPLGEFNVYADPVAAARVFALTSKEPNSTLPHKNKDLPLQPDYEDYPKLLDYPSKLSRQLKLTLFPLDITTPHELEKDFFNARVSKHKEEGSHLARWVHWFMNGVYKKIAQIEGVAEGKPMALGLHDPTPIWYMLTRDDPRWVAVPEPEDIRIETGGQWSRGANIVDRRQLNKPTETTEPRHARALSPDGPEASDMTTAEVPDDQHDSWINPRKGNRINRMRASPGFKDFQAYLLDQLFY
ncbi:pyrimidine-specific ribonucleoside hydrolase RihA [Rhypophila decipiens]|uniref:Pyrimidine-specific ribonucleoside hydrolase RihA n=1 Tax=Rhypophila decipiens TaxID=261697 RepID=A0AAN7B3E4_9PEZI|nr:pyrimidine-specific ribonucleoside hydrolase RihA [Rhypophila decipiens]